MRPITGAIPVAAQIRRTMQLIPRAIPVAAQTSRTMHPIPKAMPAAVLRNSKSRYTTNMM